LTARAGLPLRWRGPTASARRRRGCVSRWSCSTPAASPASDGGRAPRGPGRRGGGFMSQLQERIAQFRKMANDDPDNELGHFRLGQLLMEAGELEEAIRSFRRTLELFPQFSKVYQLLGN